MDEEAVVDAEVRRFSSRRTRRRLTIQTAVVSDASGQMAAQDHPSGGRLGVPLRSFSVSMARVRQSQYQELEARLRSGLLKGLMFLHLKKDP